jgi:mercuric ion transport protein
MNYLFVFEKAGSVGSSLGAVVSTMGCAFCFPAIASLGGAVGLGFLGQWEGLFINTLLPAFAWIALVINALGYFGHKQLMRSVLGMVGPALLLLSLYPWFQYGWSTYVTYLALVLMVVVSIFDLVDPAYKHCDDESCAI